MTTPRHTASKRWTRQPEERPKQILDAALRVFCARGFAQTRMDDVARKAGISKGTIYLYFDSKTALLEALIERAMAPVATQLEAMAASAPEGPVAPLLQTMLELAATRLADPDVAAVPLLVIGEAGRFPHLAQHYRERVIEAGLGAITSLIQRGIRAREFRPLDPALAARSLIATVLLQAIWSTVFARPDDTPLHPHILAGQHVDIFLNGVKTEARR